MGREYTESGGLNEKVEVLSDEASPTHIALLTVREASLAPYTGGGTITLTQMNMSNVNGS